MLCVAVVLFGACRAGDGPARRGLALFPNWCRSIRAMRGKCGVHVARAWSDRCDAMASGVVGLGRHRSRRSPQERVRSQSQHGPRVAVSVSALHSLRTTFNGHA